jgi:hypothetical protein
MRNGAARRPRYFRRMRHKSRCLYGRSEHSFWAGLDDRTALSFVAVTVITGAFALASPAFSGHAYRILGTDERRRGVVCEQCELTSRGRHLPAAIDRVRHAKYLAEPSIAMLVGHATDARGTAAGPTPSTVEQPPPAVRPSAGRTFSGPADTIWVCAPTTG